MKGLNFMRIIINNIIHSISVNRGIYCTLCFFFTFITLSCDKNELVLTSIKKVEIIYKKDLIIIKRENNGVKNKYIDTLFLKDGEYYKSNYNSKNNLYMSNRKDTIIKITPSIDNINNYILYLGNINNSPFQLYRKIQHSPNEDLYESSLYIVNNNAMIRDDIKLLSSFLYNKKYKIIKYYKRGYDDYE